MWFADQNVCSLGHGCFLRRRKYVRESESRYWEHMTPACMTEESDSENAEKIVTHQLLWRSECEFESCILGCVSISECVVCVCCLLYTSPSPRDATLSRMPSSA